MRGGGRRGDRGRGKAREGGYGRRDARPVGAASRDDRDRRDRRPDYSPRRRPDYSPRRRPDYSPGRRPDYSPGRRSPSPGSRRARRPRREDDDRVVARGNRGPTRGGRVGNPGDRDRPRDGRMSHDGDRSPAPGRGDCGYDERNRGRRDDYGDGRDPHRHGRGEGYDGTRGLPHQGRRDDYGGHRDQHREKDYERAAPYSQERDRYYHEDPGRGGSEAYNVPPAYMLPGHPSSDLNRPSLLSGRKESDYLGDPGDFGLNRDGDYLGSPGRQSIFKERNLFGKDGMSLKISATQSGRTTALYQERSRSPVVSRAAFPRPPPLYPSVPPEETEFLSRGSPMKAVDGFGTGNTPSLHDNSKIKYGDHLRDPYAERNRRTETHYSGNRGVLIEENGGTDSFYPAADVPIRGDREIDKLCSSRGMLGSDLVPFTQLKQIGDSSSSLLVKDRPYRMHSEPEFGASSVSAMNGHGMSPHDSSGHGRVHARRFSGRLSEHGSDHSDEALMDIPRQYDDEHEYVPKGGKIDKYVGNVSQNPRHISSSASLAGFKDERINHNLRPSHRMEDVDRVMLYDTENDLQHSYDTRAPVPYPHARGRSDQYSHSPGFEPIGSARRPARQHESASFKHGGDLSDPEVSPMISRKRYRSPASRDHEMDMHQADDGFLGREYYDMIESDPSPRRISRIYDMVDEDEDDPRYGMPSNHNVFSRLALPHGIGGEWTDAGEVHPHSSTLAYGHSRHKPMSQRLSRPTAHSKFGSSYVQGRGKRVLTKSEKKRMKVARHHFDGGYTSPRNELRPKKHSKSSEEDNPNESEMDHEDTPEGEDLPLQKDPPEGSEEFTKQVHQAFLKYTKMVNESPTMQKKFRDGVKGSLPCFVCGSAARKFQDVDALVSHAYHTCKVGLKTKHLGFHKALCILMGWNWLVAPDTSKSHHSITAEEVNAVKGDLMLWPPVVVIHNSSIAIKPKDTESKIVSKDEIESLLADIGIALEKAKVSHGKPANQSVFLVQFQPTISGFQEAMRIHDHFSAKNHSKEEFRQLRDGKGKQAAPVDNLDELLYGHIAVAEDVGYLDEGTKRRCVIRSKMDIEAKAEATLNLEP